CSSSTLASAADFLIAPSAAMNRREKRMPLMGKFSTARCVCAAYSASAGTFISPSESFSIRNSSDIGDRVGVMPESAGEIGEGAGKRLLAIRYQLSAIRYQSTDETIVSA